MGKTARIVPVLQLTDLQDFIIIFGQPFNNLIIFMKKLLLTLLFPLLFCSISNATHLMGGNLTYEYMGFNSITLKHQFRVTLYLYRYCSGNPTPAPLPGTMELGAFEESTTNNKSRELQVSLPLISSQFIDPPNSNDSCIFLPNVCVQEGVYQDDIELDPSTMGYYLIADRCCRNGNIANLDDPGAEGQAYYAFIPPTGIQNDAPVFATAPVPFICAADTASVLNAAFDPDGDSLVYSFVHPFRGISGQGNPNPGPPLVYNFPVPLVQYGTGYTLANPFGVGSFTEINPNTGLTRYVAPTAGFYVIAIEIQEFRNGVLIGVTRRDIQLIVISCPSNPSPNLSGAMGSGQTVHSVVAGDSLGFNVIYTDPNGDSVFVSATGPIFNGSVVNPPAVLPPAEGNVTAGTSFGWNTACNQVGTYQFFVIAVDNGCPAKTTNTAYTINVLPFEGAPILGQDSICVDQITGVNFTSNGTAGSTYNWTVTNGSITSGQGTNSIQVNFNGVGNSTITVIETSDDGCIAPVITKDVFIKPLPVSNAGADIFICSGDTGTIGVASTPGYTYSWSPAQGVIDPSDANPRVTLTNSSTTDIDTVQLTVTSTFNGCSSTDVVQVFVYPLPASEAGPNGAVCSKDSVQLGTTPTAGYTYSWSPGGFFVDSTVSNPILVPIVNGTVFQYYTVTTTNQFGCTSQDSARIRINPLPNTTASISPSQVCAGDSVILDGFGGVTLSWASTADPGNPVGTGAPVVVFPTVTTSYVLTGTSGVGCSNFDTVTVIVNPLPAMSISAPNDSICEGDSLVLTGSGAPNLSWADAGNPGTPIGTGNTITVSPTVTTSYILTGQDAFGCEGRDTITVVVNPEPTATAIVGVASLCPGVVGVQYWIDNPNPTSTYTWTVPGGVTFVSGQGTDTIVTDWPNPGTYTITVTELTAEGCPSDLISLDITVNPMLTPAAPAGDTILCANEAQNIVYSTLPAPGSTYSWSINGGTIVGGQGTNSVTVSWNLTGPAIGLLWYDEASSTVDTVCFGTSDTISVLINPIPITSAITGDISICVFDSIAAYSVTDTAGSTFQWTAENGSVLSGNGSNAITATWSTSGTYTVSVVETNSFGCNGDTVTFDVRVDPLPAANAGSDQTICNGDTANLNASGGVIYQWDNSATLSNDTISDPFAFPNTTTVYTVLVTDTNGCRNTDSIQINVNALPVVDAGMNVAICIGDQTTLGASGGVSYNWDPTGSLDDPTSQNPIADPTTTTTYTVIVTDANSCSNTDSVTVTVNPLPIISAGVDTIICQGSSVQLLASGGVTYEWIPAGDLNDPNIFNPIATPAAPTTYTVTGTDANGCENTDDITVNLNPQPIADFTANPDFVLNCEGVRVSFTDNSTDALTYSWTFGNGLTSTQPWPVTLYEMFGVSYPVTLVVTNNFCEDSLTKSINVSPLEDYLENAANVFTPNNDGLNDCFNAEKVGDFKDCTFIRIFNRWGNLVWESEDPTECWDGTNWNNDNEVPAGVYIYTIRIKNAEVMGSVHLIR